MPISFGPDAVADAGCDGADHPDAGGAAAGWDTRELPARVDGVGSDKALRCRAAVASTFLAGLELARAGELRLQQDHTWHDVRLQTIS